MKNIKKYLSIEHDEDSDNEIDNENQILNYKILKRNGELEEIELQGDNVNSDDEEYLISRKEKIDKYKESKKKYNEKKYGTDEIRLIWDLDFRNEYLKSSNNKEELEVDELEDELEDMYFEEGTLDYQTWKKIKNIDFIRSLKVDYLKKKDVRDEKFPREYLQFLRLKEIKKKLCCKRALVAIFLACYIFLFCYFIVNATEGSDFSMVSAILLGYFLGIILLGSLFICDPYFRNTKIICKKIRKKINPFYKIKRNNIVLKEPGKCSKKLYCIKPTPNRMPGSYIWCYLFEYPQTRFCGRVRDILQPITKYCKCCKKLNCCKKELPRIYLNKKNIENENKSYTIALGEGNSLREI